MWKVYILLNLEHRRTYTGSTDDFQRRFKQHNNGQVEATKLYRPWIPIYMEFYPTEVAARRREQYLKTSPGRRYLQKAIGDIINVWATSSVG